MTGPFDSITWNIVSFSALQFLFYYTIQESAVYLHVYNCLSVFELYSDC